MFFNCNLQILINNNSVDQVVEVEIKNDHAQLGSDCYITFPLTTRIFNGTEYLIDSPMHLFKTGDFIKIFAWYDNSDIKNRNQYPILTLFEGFIYEFIEGTPLKMRCLDYSIKLREGYVSVDLLKTIPGLWFEGTHPIETVLDAILTGSGITLMKNHMSFDVVNLSFINVSAYAALEWLKKEMGMTMSIIGKELYFHLANNTLNTIQLKSNVNVLAADMQKKDTAFQKYKVQVNYINPDKTKNVVEKGDPDGIITTNNLYMVARDNKAGSKRTIDFNKLVDNSLINVQLGHYKGKFTTLLYPEINLFDKIVYQDTMFSERSGVYICQSSNITLNVKGFHREIGVAYLRDIAGEQDLIMINPTDVIVK